MRDPIPSCFSGGTAIVTPPASTDVGPRVTTSVYETHLGLAALTWSRTALGLSLHVDLRLPSPASAFSSASSVSSGESAEWTDASFRFRLRPWLFWKRRGTKRFHPKGQHYDDHNQPVVDFAWDLGRAQFPPGGGPEPASRFFVAVAVDGEMLLVVGDMEAEAYKKTLTGRNTIPTLPPRKGSPYSPTLICRREHVVLPSSGKLYTTRAMVGGKRREISIDLGREEAKLSVALDGERILHVKRLKWKFRGNEEVEAEDGARVQVSWDVHRWLFGGGPDSSPPAAAAAATAEPGHAVLLFRFDRDEVEEEDVGACLSRHRRSNTLHGPDRSDVLLGLYGTGSFCSSSSGMGVVGGSKTAGKKRSLLKTRSSSSSSSASSRRSSSVMVWASAEEGELRGEDAFTLLVNVWRS